MGTGTYNGGKLCLIVLEGETAKMASVIPAPSPAGRGGRMASVSVTQLCREKVEKGQIKAFRCTDFTLH